MSQSFASQWPFVSIVKDQLFASSYDIRLSHPLREFKSSGRPIYVTRFYNKEKGLIESRDSMQMTSKKTGADYYVCRSKPANAAVAVAAGAGAAVAAAEDADVPVTTDDLFANI
jgi:hypothetical protein